jgi:hypothetical protein
LSEASHGLCLDCLHELIADKIRKKQLDEGNFDCFSGNTEYCDQTFCRYRFACMKENIEGWRKQVIEGGNGNGNGNGDGKEKEDKT